MPSIQRLGRTSLIAAAAAVALSCDDPAGNSGSIQLSLTPAGLSVSQGGTGSAAIAISRGGGFTGTVTLAISGLPAGVAAAIAPAELSGSTASATITVTVGPNVAPGTSSATITATADGVATATTALLLTIEPAPDFRLAIGTPVLTVSAGSSGTVALNITRTNFAGGIALALLNPPAGITGVFDPTPATTNVSSLTVNVAPSVTPASYTLTIQGTAAGIGERITLLTVEVQPQPGAFTINLAPAAFTLPRGNTAIVNITLTRTDYTGPITLAFENPPPGITGTFVPSTTTGNSSTFTVSVGDAVAPGFYQLRIRGTAPGFLDRVAFVQLTVTAPTGSSVEYLFCDASQVPVFFAYQDGNGAWKVVTSSTQAGITRFVFTIAAGRGGVLAVYHSTSALVSDALSVRRLRTAARPRIEKRGPVGTRLVGRTPDRALLVDQYRTEVRYASAAELAQDGIDNCGQTQETKTVTGTVAGVSPGEFGIVSLGSTNELFIGGVSTNPVTFADVPGGAVDFVGSRMTQGNVPDRVVVFRNLDVPDGDALPSTIDFAGPASSAPATANVTITGGNLDLLEIFTEVITVNSQALLWFDLNPNQSNVRPWAGLNQATMTTGDFHGLVAFATPPSGGGFRVTLKYVGPVADQTLVMGPTINAPAATQVASGPYPRYRFQGTIPADYNKGVSVDVTRNDEPGNPYSIMVTNAWLAVSGNPLAYDLTMPDVSGLAGFPAAARLTAGVSDASVGAFGFNGPGIFDLKPILGTEFKAAARTVQIGVPQ